MGNMIMQEEWPDRSAYDAAMKDWTHTLQDPILRQGKLLKDNFGITRFGGAGLYVSIYRVDNWLVRCFRSNGANKPPVDICDRYAAIDGFNKDYATQVPALVPVHYQDQGINVLGKLFPIVTMPFLQNVVTLGKFVRKHHDEPAVMSALTQAWVRMIQDMEAIPMAHGDLDLTNVLVEQRGADLVLRLVDYDNVWIPALAGRTQTEGGHEHFQHPAFLPPNHRPYTSDMDRFAALVIYISLRALAMRPQLYAEWTPDESTFLLTLRSDYEDPGRSDGRLEYLNKLPGMAPYIAELRRVLLNPSQTPQSLTTLLREHPESQTVAPAPDVVFRPSRKGVSVQPPIMRFDGGVANPNAGLPQQPGAGAPPPPPQTVTHGPPNQGMYSQQGSYPQHWSPPAAAAGMSTGTMVAIAVLILLTIIVLGMILSSGHGSGAIPGLHTALTSVHSYLSAMPEPYVQAW